MKNHLGNADKGLNPTCESSGF